MLRRCLLAVALALPAVLPGGPAAGAESPAPASLGDLVVAGREVRAVLTAPATTAAENVALGSVRATVGGTSVPVVVTRVPAQRRATVVVIDTSGSMGESGIAAAVRAATSYLSAAPADVQVGLVAFSDSPRLLVPVTGDRARLRAALATLRSGGETAMYDAVGLALRALGSSGSRSVILISDGGDTSSVTKLSAVTAAVRTSGARVEAVAFRTKESKDAPLTQIARAGDGAVVPAADDDALTAAFRGAATALAGQVQLRLTVPAGVGGSQTLLVQGLANGRTVQASTTLNLPAAPVTPSPRPAATTTVSGGAVGAAPTVVAQVTADRDRWLLIAGGAAVFAGLVVLLLSAAGGLLTPVARKRMRELSAYTVGSASALAAELPDAPSGISQHALSLSDRFVEGRAAASRAGLLLQRADLPLRVNEWYVLRAVAIVTGACLGVLALRGSVAGTVVGAALGAALGVVLPPAFLNAAAARRAKAFEQQLPDVITLVATSLSTGFSLSQALDAVARDTPEPAAKEFSRALAETRIGADLEDSLDRLAERMDSTNLGWTTMAIRIQRQVGGNLAETLRTTATTLRDRASLYRQVRALSAEGRLSAYILIALPIFLFLYLAVVNRPYISMLWTHPLGWLMSGGGLVALAIGMIWMRNVVKVEA